MFRAGDLGEGGFEILDDPAIAAEPGSAANDLHKRLFFFLAGHGPVGERGGADGLAAQQGRLRVVRGERTTGGNRASRCGFQESPASGIVSHLFTLRVSMFQVQDSMILPIFGESIRVR